jgi:transposase-like protein
MNLPTANGRSSAEVSERATRRRFTAEYKRRILAEYEATALGERGAFLRREGLYSSHLDGWRKQRDAGALDALATKRGRKPKDSKPLADENAKLRRKLARAERELAQARAIIEIQKKVAEALGTPIETPEPDESE